MSKPSHILLIDDNKIDNLFHARVVKKCNGQLDVITMESAEEGIEYLKGTGAFPDIIFLDINMPGMNGWEFLEAYRRLGDKINNTLVIVMLGTFETATPEMHSKTEGLFAGFVPKPLTKETFDEVVALYRSKKT